MKSKMISRGEQRMFAVILETGDEVVECLKRFSAENSLTAASFTGIGAFSEVTLGFFQWEQKDYREIPVGNRWRWFP